MPEKASQKTTLCVRNVSRRNLSEFSGGTNPAMTKVTISRAVTWQGSRYANSYRERGSLHEVFK